MGVGPKRQLRLDFPEMRTAFPPIPRKIPGMR